MEDHNLQLAPQKKEAVLLIGRKRTLTEVEFKLNEVTIKLKKYLKYLEVTFDKNLTFAECIEEIAQKVSEKVNRLCRLLPRVGGAGEKSRQLLFFVAKSIMLYAVPIRKDGIRLKSNATKLERVQRKIALKISRAYRTVSAEANMVVAGAKPIKLLVEKRSHIYAKRKKADKEEER